MIIQKVMNIGIFCCSLKYINRSFDSVVSLASWLYEELSIVNYTDEKLIKQFHKRESFPIAESIIHLNKNKDILDKIISHILYIDYEFDNYIFYLAIKLLLEHGADIKPIQRLLTASFWIFFENIELIDLLITKYNVDISTNDNEILIAACGHGNFEMVKLLIEAGADIHAKNETPLMEACVEGHVKVVKLLINLGVDIHFNDDYPLKLAVFRGHVETARLLLESGADVHAENDKALRSIIPSDLFEMIELLLQFGADPLIAYDKLLIEDSSLFVLVLKYLDP